MAKHYKLFLPGLMVFLISGCAHVKERNLRLPLDPRRYIHPGLENPDAYKVNPLFGEGRSFKQ